jgi:hypothetical protein
MNKVVNERLMTIADLSAMLGVPINTLYVWGHPYLVTVEWRFS